MVFIHPKGGIDGNKRKMEVKVRWVMYMFPVIIANNMRNYQLVVHL